MFKKYKMKKPQFLYLLLLVTLPLFSQTQDNYDLKAGNGKGFRFWNGSNTYKIHMGNLNEYKYGPVTDYSIKMNMSNTPGRGWTWGVVGQTPIAALNTLGDFQIAKDLYLANGWLRVKGQKGLLFHDYAGGFRMIDNTWIRTYGGKSFYHDTGIMRTDGEFQVGSGGNRFRVTNSGSVGIGTTSPSEKLHVVGNILSNKLLLNDPLDTSDWNLNWQSGFFQSFNAANAPEPNQWFWGINMNHGSNNPSYRYNGQIAIKNSANSPTIYFRSTGKNGNGVWSRIVHREGNQFINGKLGLGTTTFGSHKLAVEGSIGAREIKVEASGWSDFVFYKDYKLPTLEEVAAHIREKGHLKDIPSAKEVTENGIYLGEMDAKLLQKIEELTLYTLEQQKQLQNHSDTNKKLKLQNRNLEQRLAKLEALLLK